MKRRAFLFSAALAPLAGVLPQAIATQTSASAPAPSLPYRDVHVASDAKRVMVFFAFSCPACRAYHNLVQSWAETLPSSLSFEFVPVVVPDANHVIAARAWYAAQLAAPSRMNQFAESVYSLIQDFKKPISRPETWAEAAKIAGITGFTSAWPKVPAASIALSAKLLELYRITETPSMAIGGRYVITPDNANGEEQMFIALANGLVSKQLHEAN